METGMADYAHKAATTGSIYLDGIWEYDLYCHYVAGLVGEGLSRLFSASGKEADWIASQLDISNSVGLLLQKTNIIRDFREDVDQRRFFWPREIWGREEYGCGAGAFKHMREMYESGNEQRAAWVQSGMIVDALRHATDALDYLQFLRNQSVFNFVAIPVTMAMATLELCFMNSNMFQRNIKIRKAEAASVCSRLLVDVVLLIWCSFSSSCVQPIPETWHTSSVTMHARSTPKLSLPTPTSSVFPLPAARYEICSYRARKHHLTAH
jgi:farnesyl-diphosphate farnesyltransferase